MKQKKLSKKLVMYEIRNILGNPFVFIFGILFPIVMIFILTKAAEVQAPQALWQQIKTEMFITVTLIMPMAIVLVGYSATYSQELQDEIPLRMELFGFSQRTTFVAKIIAQFIVTTFGCVLYTIVSYAAIDLKKPTWQAALCLIVCLYLCAVLFFALAHGVALLFKKFGPTYAVTMGLYFTIMILSGMMGVRTPDLPEALQKMAKLLPMSYISNDFGKFWTGGSYNFAPLVQSYLFFGAVTGIILILAFRKERRNIL